MHRMLGIVILIKLKIITDSQFFYTEPQISLIIVFVIHYSTPDDAIHPQIIKPPPAYLTVRTLLRSSSSILCFLYTIIILPTDPKRLNFLSPANITFGQNDCGSFT